MILNRQVALFGSHLTLFPAAQHVLSSGRSGSVMS